MVEAKDNRLILFYHYIPLEDSKMLNQLDKYKAYVPLVSRVLIGLIFLLHGLAKFGLLGGGSLSGTIEMFGMMGMPVPAVTATLVALVETVGGLALILGVGTRISALLLSIVMVVAILTVKLPMSINPIAAAGPMPGWELDLALLAGTLTVLILGAGEFALEDRMISSSSTAKPATA